MSIKLHKTTKGIIWLPEIAAIAFFSAAFAGAANNVPLLSDINPLIVIIISLVNATYSFLFAP